MHDAAKTNPPDFLCHFWQLLLDLSSAFAPKRFSRIYKCYADADWVCFSLEHSIAFDVNGDSRR